MKIGGNDAAECCQLSSTTNKYAKRCIGIRIADARYSAESVVQDSE